MGSYKGVTISEIAKRANVSVATVSRALNGTGVVKQSTKELIFAIAEELERKAAKPDAPRTRVLLASFPELENPFYVDIIRGIVDTASTLGYKVIFYSHTNFYSKSSYDFLINSHFYDGLLIAHAIPDAAVIDAIRARVPVVTCSEHNTEYSIPYIAIDDYKAACTAVDFLISRGRKKIALVNSSLRNNYAVLREKAYCDCLRKSGLPVNENWITHLAEINFNLALTAISGILEQEDRPDAFFCISDVYAAAVISAASQHGLSVPGDISVVGFDNISLSTMTVPPITTISQPRYQIGVQACGLLIDQLEYPSSTPRQIILDTELILRGST